MQRFLEQNSPTDVGTQGSSTEDLSVSTPSVLHSCKHLYDSCYKRIWVYGFAARVQLNQLVWRLGSKRLQ